MKKAWAFLPALLWMGFIFYMSAMPGDASSKQSGFVTQFIISILQLISDVKAGGLSQQTISFIVRKGAHMAEYAVLFLLARYGFSACGAKRPGWLGLYLCILYAASDEFHQSFVPGRTASAIDVMIDTFGACLSLSAYHVLRRLLSKRYNI